MTSTHASSFNRRSFLKASALALAGATVVNAAGKAPQAHALGPILGTVIDFSAAVPNPQEVKNRGHLGAVRYVSKPRLGAEWMKAKPVTLTETKAAAGLGLATASVYQFGKAETADWKQGAAGAAIHAPQAIAIHAAAGGPAGRPIYVAIDDNPTRQQYETQIRPYLKAFKTALTAANLRMGVYGNYNTIEWALADGLGEFFWQHDWGSDGKIHPKTTIHQKSGLRDTISGIEVDINNVYASDWGQWTPGTTAVPPVPAQPATPPASNDGVSVQLPDMKKLSSQAGIKI